MAHIKLRWISYHKRYGGLLTIPVFADASRPQTTMSKVPAQKIWAWDVCILPAPAKVTLLLFKWEYFLCLVNIGNKNKCKWTSYHQHPITQPIISLDYRGKRHKPIMTASTFGVSRTHVPNGKGVTEICNATPSESDGESGWDSEARITTGEFQNTWVAILVHSSWLDEKSSNYSNNRSYLEL